jgi:pyridinium-3,5-bisthiocarboxylic acid mononucleotide nickel chelatase
MKIAYLDCFSGISGDMFLGALIDIGLSPVLFEEAVRTLNVGARVELSRVNRSGISATKVSVIDPASTQAGTDTADRRTAHSHSHLHPHHDDASHPGHTPSKHEHTHGRGLTDIRAIIAGTALSSSVKKTSLEIFERLGQAESKIHNVPVDRIHFHEVGAVDALVDIVCAAVGAEALGVDEFVCSPLNVGGGTVECAHGTFPVPAPATVELLNGVPAYSSGIQSELVTPTGAAIVKTLAKRFGRFPEMIIEKTGYGAGTRDFVAHPNVLRIVVGEQHNEVAQTTPKIISILEANLDDLNPQVVGYVIEKLLESGALDVFATPIQMKKNRPGTLMTVLAKTADADKLAKIIFSETSTLGVRRREEQRQVLAREWQTVQTRFGGIRIKLGKFNGTITSFAPEYEDCRRAAVEHRVPLKLVMQEAIQAYLQDQTKE